MAGIRDISVFLPRHRVCTGGLRVDGGKKTSRPVAHHDEDALTMGFAALSGLGPAGDSASLYFTASRYPYDGVRNADLLAHMAGMNPEAIAQDMGTSSGGEAHALHSSMRDVERGGSATSRVIAVEYSRPFPGSDEERDAADSAAALELSALPGLAEFLASGSRRSGLLGGKWRLEGKEFYAAADPRFSMLHGVEETLVAAVGELLRGGGVSLSGVRWPAVAVPGLRQYRKALKRLGMEIPSELERVYRDIGDCGVAMPYVLLYQALRHASPGDLVLAGGASGAGADVFLLRATEKTRSLRDRRSLFEGPEIPVDPLDVLRSRGFVPTDELVPNASPVQIWREGKDLVGLVAQKCNSCSSIQYPRRRVCRECREKDDFTDFPLSRKGEVFTYTVDHLFPSPYGATAMAVVDLEGGGRIFTQVTDFLPGSLRIGLPVELCLRRLHQGGGFNNYFWKARPMIVEEGE